MALRSSHPGEKRVLRVGLLGPVHHVDPRQSQDFLSGMVQWQVFETPYGPPFADDPPPAMLFREPLRRESERGSRTVFSAPIRNGVRFSDGALMTPNHVVAALSRAAPLMEQADVEARGERIFFILKRPNSRFEIALTQRFCAIVREGDDGRLLGTGPYMLASDSRPELVRLVRNPHARTDSTIEEVFFKSYPPGPDGRPDDLLAALRDGQVDFTNVLSREELGQIRGVRKWFEPGHSTGLLYFNTKRAGLRKPQVRRALALAVSRNQLTKLCYTNALAFKASGILPPMMGSWRDGIRHNLAQAKELLEGPGIATPRQLSLLLIFGPRQYLPDPNPVAEAVAEQIGELGIKINIIRTRDEEDYTRKVVAGHYDLVLSGWIADTPDPADFLDSLLSSRLIPEEGKNLINRANLSRFQSRRMDEALAAFRNDSSLENRTRIVELMTSEMPLLPIMYGPTIVAHSWRVKNFRMSPLGIPFFSTLQLQD